MGWGGKMGGRWGEGCVAKWGGSWLDGAVDCYLIIMQANIRDIMKF